MAALVGGIGALILGFILLIAWWNHFLAVLAGAIPILLLLGGALAAYLGYEERKDKQQIEAEMAKNSPPPAPPVSPAPTEEEFNRVKQESERYKAELEELQKKLKSAEK
jgi:hypothetical protein